MAFVSLVTLGVAGSIAVGVSGFGQMEVWEDVFQSNIFVSLRFVFFFSLFFFLKLLLFFFFFLFVSFKKNDSSNNFLVPT